MHISCGKGIKFFKVILIHLTTKSVLTNEKNVEFVELVVLWYNLVDVQWPYMSVKYFIHDVVLHGVIVATLSRYEFHRTVCTHFLVIPTALYPVNS